MKSFLEIAEEADNKLKPAVLAFGRMNPPTSGHEKLINKVHELANHHQAPHHVVLSHSQDTKKNPLSASQKVKHAIRAFPGTNISAASKEHPTIMQHAKRLHDAGHRHLIVVAGSDRVKEFHDLLHHYNGHKDHYNFKKIEVKSAGQRDPDAAGAEGMSASKMREHAKNGNFDEFHKGVPSKMKHEHAKAMYNDLRKGMGIHEDVNHGLFKAIFITGGPGSGKDLVIREGIPEDKIVELDLTQATNYLLDKQTLSEETRDPKREAIRCRMPLVINGTADRMESIVQVKEELEELGYDTMMVYVDTTNDVSRQRNLNLKRMVSEEVRMDRWRKAQESKVGLYNLFEDFNLCKNNDDLEMVEDSITDVYEHVSEFLERTNLSETAHTWLVQNNKLDINKDILSIFENNSPDQQMVRKAGKIDKVTDGDVKSNSGYAFRTYESSKPTLTVLPTPKIPNFQKDKETGKKKTAVNDTNKKMKTPGVGPELDTRPGRLGFGLGDQTYSEEVRKDKKTLKNFKNDPDNKIQAGRVGPTASNAQPASSFYPGGSGQVTNYPESVEHKYTEGTAGGSRMKFSQFLEAIDSPAESGGSMGVGGVLNGATNSEPMEVAKDKTGERGPNIKKKKKFGDIK